MLTLPKAANPENSEHVPAGGRGERWRRKVRVYLCISPRPGLILSMKDNKMGELAASTAQSNVQWGLEAFGRGKLTRQANEPYRQGENSQHLLDFKPWLSFLDHLSWVFFLIK